MPDDEIVGQTVEAINAPDADAGEPVEFGELSADDKLDIVFNDQAEEDAEGDDAPAQDEAEETPDVEAPAANDSEDAEAYRKMVQAWTDNPKAFLESLAEQLPAEDRPAIGVVDKKTLMSENNPLGLDPEDGDEGEWTPKSAFEKAAAPLVAQVKSIPKVIETKMAESVPYIQHANLMAEVVNAKLEAALEVLGLKLEEPDMAALHEALGKPQATYRSVAQAAMKQQMKAAIAKRKQATRARPETPAPESSAPVTRLTSGISFSEAMRRARG